MPVPCPLPTEYHTSVRRARNSETYLSGEHKLTHGSVGNINPSFITRSLRRPDNQHRLTTWNSEEMSRPVETHLSWLTHTFHQQGCLVPHLEYACSLTRSFPNSYIYSVVILYFQVCPRQREWETSSLQSGLQSQNWAAPSPAPCRVSRSFPSALAAVTASCKYSSDGLYEITEDPIK